MHRDIMSQDCMNQDSSQYSIPGFFLPHLEMYVSDAGGDASALCAAAGISRASFIPEKDRLSEAQLYALVGNARRQCAEPALGFEVGARFSISSFGLLSRTLMSCADLREVARMLERYSVLVLPLARFSTFESDRHLGVEVTALSRYPLLNQTIFEALLACWDRVVQLLVGRAVTIDKVTCRFEAPDYAARYAEAGVEQVEFSADRNLIFLKRDYAALRLTTANAVDARAMREACERELIRSRANQTLSEQVRDQIRYYLDTGPSSAGIAAHLHMTDRTFRRRLAEEGTSFRQLVYAVRREMAVYYLDQTKLQISEIALKLGYQETSNFRAAFKKWTGVSPRAWRQRVR